MSDGNFVVDLFGDAVLPRGEGRGRPEVLWCREKSNKVLLAFARGLSVKQAASIIGVSAPTLRKVYFSEVAKRAEAALRLEMTQLSRLNDLAAGGNVAAEKELLKQMEKMRQRDQARALAPAPTERPVKAAKLGKKEAVAQAAQEVRGLYEPPRPPGTLN